MTLCEFDEAAHRLREDWTSFIVALPPLYPLDVNGMGQALGMKRILVSHGSRLKQLKVHEQERDCTLRLGQLQLGKSCF